MEKQYTYDAFISYRHSDLDKFVAENLHKRLEAFRLPLSVSRKKYKGTKTHIQRIFRDKDELPIASDLASPILTALKQSEFLIVICSPRTSESVWVQREIETFISLHGRDHILAVLIEGEPIDAFPKSLVETTKTITLPDGTEKTETIMIEPLAADVRGKDKREVLKNIKSEILRLAAPMFGCGYDELKQRHRERKVKFIVRTLTAACAFFLCFGGFSTFQALRINHQAKQIKEQSDQIHTQYQEILVTSLKQEGDNALSLLEKGDRIASIRTSLDALPNKANPDRPLVPHVEYALAEALYAYQSDSGFMCDRVLNHNTDVSFMKVSPSGDKILTLDATKTLHIFKASTGEELHTYYDGDSFSFYDDEDYFLFISETEFVYLSSDYHLIRYDFELDKPVYDVEFSSIYKIKTDSTLTHCALSDYTNLYIVNLSDGSVIESVENTPVDSDFTIPSIDSTDSIAETMSFNQDGSLLAFSANSITANTTGIVKVLDTANGNIINTIPLELPNITALYFHDRDLFINTIPYFDFDNQSEASLFSYDSDSTLGSYDLDTNEWNYFTTLKNQTIKKMKYLSTKHSYLQLQGFDTLYSIDPETGAIIGENHMSSGIVATFFYPDSDTGLCFTKNGEATSINTYDGFSYQVQFNVNSTSVKAVTVGDSYYAALPYRSKSIILYTIPQNEKLQYIADCSLFPTVMISPNHDSLLVYDSSASILHSYSYPDGTPQFEIPVDSISSGLSFVGKNGEYFCMFQNDVCHFYHANTGELVQKINLPETFFTHHFYYDNSTGLLCIFSLNSYLTIDPADFHVSPEVISTDDKLSFISSPYVAIHHNIYVVNKKEDTIDVYDAELKKKTSIPVNANYIETIYTNEDGTLLFVSYKDGVTELYQTDSLAKEYTFDTLEFVPDSCITLSDGSYILTNHTYGYHCTKTNEIRAFFPSIRAFDKGQNRIITEEDKKLYSMPVYTLDLLIEEANKQLNNQ